LRQQCGRHTPQVKVESKQDSEGEEGKVTEESAKRKEEKKTRQQEKYGPLECFLEGGVCVV